MNNTQSASKSASACTRIIQVTDAHLFSDSEEKLVGMNCEESLQDVLSLIQASEENPALVLFTGDASQDNSMASYQRLELSLCSLNLPQYWIPGNHDELQQMQSAIGPENPCFQSSFAVNGWRIILLNSSVPNHVYGRLAEAELLFLRRSLKECTEPNVMICLHHNPVPVAAGWLQHHALKNPADLFAEIDKDPRVRVILFGHIHHELRVERKGVCYLGSPSTCIQFHPSSNDFALDVLNPGYRWLDLYADGTFNTGIRRVTGKSYDVDFSGIGY